MISTNYNVSFHAQLLKNIINSSNEIVFAKDLNGIYRYVNKIFCNLFNLTKGEIIGKDDFSLFSEIDALKEILPICSYCKKIRDDKGYWEQVDVYIHNHSHIDFSHSICPDCLKIHYPDFDNGKK